SDDGRYLLIAGSGTLEVWDLRTRKLASRLGGSDAVDYQAVLRADGQSILTAGAVGTLVQWEMTPALARTLLTDNHGGWVLGLEVSRDGHRLVSSDGQRHVRVFDLAGAPPAAPLAQ